MMTKPKDTLLLVGNTKSDRAELRAIFRLSFQLLEAEDTAQGTLLLRDNADSITAVLADIPLTPGRDLRALIEASHIGPDDQIPVIVFVPDASDIEQEDYAFLLGASDVVHKPYTTLSIQRRVQILVDLYLHKWHLERLVNEQNETIRHSNQVMLDTLSSLIEQRSTESGKHVLRIRSFTRILLEEVSRTCPEYGLTSEDIDIISSAAALHDIGKIGIPDAVLNKSNSLDPEEFAIMQRHTTLGGQLVSQLTGLGDSVFLRYAYNIALYHHERWDGTGYPTGLSGDDIPICAQVVGLADSFDALTTLRVYKPAYPCDIASTMILNGDCGTFSPRLLMCFKHVHSSFFDLAERYADGLDPGDAKIVMPPLPAPIWKTHDMDSLQLAQMKYETMLHYSNDTAIELDADHRVFHVVYNPDPDFEPLFAGFSYQDMLDRAVDMIHPEDRSRVKEIFDRVQSDLFERNLQKLSFQCRVLGPRDGEFHPYRVTILRVFTGHNVQRLMMALFHRSASSATRRPTSSPILLPSELPSDLLAGALHCRMDPSLTILGGASSLHSLTGYQPEEIRLLFDNSLLELIVPEDRADIVEKVHHSGRRGVKSEMTYRLLRKHSSPVWVLGKIRLQGDSYGEDTFYHTITDISYYQDKQKQLREQTHCDQLLREITGTILFDWNLSTDRMYCSRMWEKRFGYQPMQGDFSAILSSATHFHPDDLSVLREKAEQLKSGTPVSAVDVRIADQKGHYCWYKVCGTVRVRDRVRHIIGLLTDIDDLKQSALALQERADRDALTQLYNKSSIQWQINSYLSSIRANEWAGLLILDLDNFKTVNDTYGHLYGDALLTQVGTTLRKLFRAHDIIGRIGGDEFLVLLKDVPNSDFLHTRCDLLLSAFRDLLGRLMPDLSVSCSIGGAVYPLHGGTYSELFQHADAALYNAKNQGKNCFCIYDPKSLQHLVGRLGRISRTTQVDSDTGNAVSDSDFIRFVFQRLYESRNIPDTIDALLPFIGARFNVSRVYIFENIDDGRACCNTFEWCNVGIEPMKDQLQYLSYQDDIPGWKDVYDENGMFYCTDISQLAEPYRMILEPQGIKSMLHCRILHRGAFQGYMGFDECTSNRLWTQGQVSSLSFLAEVLGVFLMQERDASTLS